jgi:hypothetical protein
MATLDAEVCNIRNKQSYSDLRLLLYVYKHEYIRTEFSTVKLTMVVISYCKRYEKEQKTSSIKVVHFENFLAETVCYNTTQRVCVSK